MRSYIAFIPDLYAEFDPAIHATEDQRYFEFEVDEVEDQLTTVQFEREQSGWQFLSPSQPKNFVISWSPTDDGADALVLARGRVTEPPSNLLGMTQTIVGRCAPKDINDRLLEFVKATVGVKSIHVEPLFSDFSPDDPASFLVARSEVLHVDPATHEIRLNPEATPTVIHDMRDITLFEGEEASDGGGEYGNLVRTVRAKLTIDFEQSAEGINRVSLSGIDSLDPDFLRNLSSNILLSDAEGWSKAEGGFQLRVAQRSQPMDVGTRYRSSTLLSSPVVRLGTAPGQGEGGINRQDELDHVLFGNIMVFRAETAIVPMHYEYSQSRREEVFAGLDLPVQPTGLEDEDEEVLQLTLNDIFSDPDATDYEPNTAYVAGDLRNYNGETYRCVADHFSEDFRQKREGIPDLPINASAAYASWYYGKYGASQTYWTKVSSEWPVKPSMYSFLDTTRGRRVVEHLMLRLRKIGIRKLRNRRLSLVYRWQDAVHIKLGEGIRFLAPDGDGLREVVGIVIASRKRWSGDDGATVTIEVGISFGEDTGEFGIIRPEDRYVEDGYGENGYGEIGTLGGISVAGSDLIYFSYGDAVRKPVDVGSLGGGGAILSIRIGGKASEQLAMASALASRAEDVKQACIVRPSWCELRMRPLPQYDVLIRQFDVFGVLLTGPQGVTI